MHFARWGLAALCILFSANAEAAAVRGQISFPRRAAGDSAFHETVVYVDTLPARLLRKYKPKPTTVNIVQKGRRFSPQSAVIVVGSTVRFENQDNVYHNAFSVSPARRFDLGKYPPRSVREVTFDRPGAVDIYDDIYPKMAAYLLVLPHRFFTRPDRTGAFTLPKLPAGAYVLRAWHPKLGRISQRVVMPKRGDLHVRLSF
jgi:plastocyanin